MSSGSACRRTAASGSHVHCDCLLCTSVLPWLEIAYPGMLIMNCTLVVVHTAPGTQGFLQNCEDTIDTRDLMACCCLSHNPGPQDTQEPLKLSVTALGFK